MTRKQKNAWMFYILTNEREYRFDIDKDFFMLDSYEVVRLSKYAELFNIKPRKGKSRARTLWDRVHEDLPF